MLGAEALALEHPAHAFFQERTARTRASLAESLAGYVPEPGALAIQLLALMDGLQLFWLSQPGFDLARAWRSAADVLLPLRPAQA